MNVHHTPADARHSPNFSPELNIFPERIYIRVIDPFTIKPLDVKTIMDHTRATRGRILTVEDHYYEGGRPQKKKHLTLSSFCKLHDYHEQQQWQWQWQRQRRRAFQCNASVAQSLVCILGCAAVACVHWSGRRDTVWQHLLTGRREADYCVPSWRGSGIALRFLSVRAREEECCHSSLS